MMIDKTKELVEEKYTIANGYDHDAKVNKLLKNTCIREWTRVIDIILDKSDKLWIIFMFLRIIL